MIVKNEQKFLEECLRSVRDIASEIIVLDTGSEDNTLEIAQKYDCKIYNFEWVNDFSAARNASIQFANSDWILWLDADERLIPESIPELKKLLKSDSIPTAYILQIKNLLADGKNFRLSGAHRLFTNHKGIYFSGRIHEQIAYSLNEIGGRELKCRVSLMHLGYGLDIAEQEKKNTRNRQLLLQMVKEEPNNAYAHYTLAQNYGLDKNWQLALKHYQIALDKHKFNPDMTCSLYNTYAEALWQSGKDQAAETIALKSIDLISQQVGAYYLLFKINEKKPHALNWLLKLKKMNDLVGKQGTQLSTDVLFSADDIFWEIIKQYELQKKPESVLEYVDLLSSERQNHPLVLIAKARALLSTNNSSAATQILEDQLLANNPRALDLLGFIYIHTTNFEKAINIYRRLSKILPQEPGIIKRLAGLYAKTGQADQASALIAQLNQSN